MNLINSQQDLDIAKNQIEVMATTKNFKVFYEAWENYLIRIERSWERAERILRDRKGIQQWIKPYKVLRKKDPLLKYLKQARNAETHAVTNTMGLDTKIAVKDKLGRPFTVRNIKTSIENKTLNIDIDTGYDALFLYEANVIPSVPKFTKIVNRGKRYNPPVTHLGNDVGNIHPVDAAKNGLMFYQAFLAEAEKKYF